ncbi:hypothetical protein BCR39DRAFT_196975 [Naematelia encephala]|uniref:J domain-containing protein n=1 Tax=Naematelia encephala TaxID=71784 RepID=A0A1Y2BHS6_9TREE|nr:hypothetical protein BCR39DRAFT_196975 [Naematelia encephala]
MEFRTHFRKPPSKRHPIAQDISLPDERFFKHVEDIFERQKRRGPVSWDDSFIFPLSSKINVDSDGKHATGEQYVEIMSTGFKQIAVTNGFERRSYNRSVTVNPFNQVAPRRYFEPPKQIPRLLVERHRQTKARDIKSKPRKEPKQPSVIQNLSAEPVETRTRPHRHNSQRDSPGRESSTRREATSNTVIRLPGISPANSSSKLPELQQAITLQRTISEERESILEQEEIRRRKEKERIQQAMARTVNRLSRRNQMPSQAPPPIRVIVKDPVGYYRQLGLVPRGDFVNVGRAVDVDELIKKAWRETAAKKHPDMEGGSHASFLALSKAFRSVRTCEFFFSTAQHISLYSPVDGRIKYNRGHGIDHLNYQP